MNARGKKVFALMLASVLVAFASITTSGCEGILGIAGTETLATDSGQKDGTTNLADGNAPIDTGTDQNTQDASDAGTIIDTGIDAFDGTPPCNLLEDFGTPVMLTSVSTTENEGSPHLTEDELTIYFDGIRTENGGSSSFDIFYATRTDLTDSFGPYTRIASADTEDQEYSPVVTLDGLTLYFERKINATDVDYIYSATRTSTTADFGVPAQVAGINQNNYTASPYVRGDGTSLWFVAVVGSGSNSSINIFNANFVAGTGFVSTQDFTIGAGEEQFNPAVSRDALAIYYGWTHAATGPIPKYPSIWVSTRASTSASFGNPSLVNNVSTGQGDRPGTVSADGCRLYLASQRPGLNTDGTQDIYVASRPTN